MKNQIPLEVLASGDWVRICRFGIFSCLTILWLIHLYFGNGHAFLDLRELLVPEQSSDFPFYSNAAVLAFWLCLFVVSLCLELACLAFWTKSAASDSPHSKLASLLLRSLGSNFPFLLFQLLLLAQPNWQISYFSAGLLVMGIAFLQRRFSRFKLSFSLQRPILKSKVWLVLPFVLVEFMLPNFFTVEDRSKVSSVKANMHTFQTIVETYAVDWGGVYSASPQAIKFEATQAGRDYWKDFTNPCTGKSGYQLSYQEYGKWPLTPAFIEIIGIRFYRALPANLPPERDSRCKVLYQVNPADGPIVYYQIYGTTPEGTLLRDREKEFFLSNS